MIPALPSRRDIQVVMTWIPKPEGFGNFLGKDSLIKFIKLPFLTQPMDPEKKKFERLIFPTKYVIPKSLSRLATGQVRFRVTTLKPGRSYRSVAFAQRILGTTFCKAKGQLRTLDDSYPSLVGHLYLEEKNTYLGSTPHPGFQWQMKV